ncbi:MAG: choice-of-anchor Q domain-containing protein [Thermomicrobiales bacterium]
MGREAEQNASTAGTQGGGIQNAFSNLMIAQTIVASNIHEDCGSIGTWISGGYNLDSDGSCPWTEPSDISNGDPGLGPLANNGGPTMTHLPAPSGDAVDNGPLFCLPADQRGEPRPSEPACDIGAVEIQPGPAFVLCADYYTGRVLSPLSGQCGARRFELGRSRELSACVLYRSLHGRRQLHLWPTMQPASPVPRRSRRR